MTGRSRLAPLALLALALLLAPTAAQEATEAEAAYARGAAAYQARRWGEAEGAFRAALARDPAHGRALNDLAWLLVTAEDPAFRRPEEAAALAERALAVEPERPAYQDTLATAWDALGRHLEAARLELRAARGAPSEPAFPTALVAFAERGLAGAADPAPQAPAPEARAELLALRGWGRLLGGQEEPAGADLDQARALGAGAEALIEAGRARLLVKRREWAAAAEAAERALGDPSWRGDLELHRLRGQALREAGRPREALEALEEALALGPGELELQLEVARAWAAQGEPGRALGRLAAAEEAVETRPPLWPGQWLARLNAYEAELHDGLAAVDSAAALQHRRDALRARLRGVAARAEDDALDARLLGEAPELWDWARDLAPGELRARLAERLLDQAAPPRLTDVSAAALPADARGRRVALADLDGDGDCDLLLDGGRLYLNDGAGRFQPAGPCGLRGGAGGVLADFDRDGDLDVYVIGHGPRADRLFRNESTPTRVRFLDVTEDVLLGGVTDDFPSEGAAWGDLNRDGYPDLYVANYELPGEPLARGTPDRLYLSDGRGGFVDAAARVATPDLRCGRGVSLADFDQDGDDDVFVSNYRLDADCLFLSDGRGGVREVAAARGVAGRRVRGSFGHTIGAAWGDLDLDGDLDLVAARLAHPRFIEFSDTTGIYLQEPGGGFREVRVSTGIRFEETHAHPTLLDLENDGDLDLYLTAVYPARPASLWRNRLDADGALRFEDVSWGAGARVWDGWGSAAADLDGDGDQDLVVCAGGRVVVLRNDAPGGRSVRLRLVGTRSDTWGAGATATLVDGRGRRLVRQVQLGHGTTCQSEPVLHFGVGDAPGPFALEVRWPSGVSSRASLGVGAHRLVEEAPPPGR